MRVTLASYLAVTGGLTLLVLAMPSLVVLGFFMLVVPGLILSLMPTAFLWGLIFAVGSWIVRSVASNPRLIIAGALSFTALAIWAIPQPSILKAKAALTEYRLPEVMPQKPIKPKGDILIAAQLARWDNANRDALGFRPWSCDTRCLALLFEPGVTSVTMDRLEKIDFDALKAGRHIPGAGARTYRLVPRAQCTGLVLKPDLDGRIGHFGETMDDNKALAAAWIAKLSTEVCLVGEPAIKGHNMMIRMGSWRITDTDTARRNWSFPSGEARAEFSDIHDGKGQMLFRMYNLVAPALSTPFMIGTSGGIENFRFGWNTQILPKGVSREWEAPVKALDAILDVQRKGNMLASVKVARRTVSALLADPGVPEAQLQTASKTWLGLLEKQPATAEDAALLKGLLADPRLGDLEGAWVLPKAFSAQVLRDIYPKVIAKLANWPDDRGPQSSPLGQVLKNWPEGFFAHGDEATDSLLNDPSRRRRALGLIARLSDRGATAAPLLADIVEFHLKTARRYRDDSRSLPETEKYGGYAAHNSTASSAVEALCRIGPAAASVLPKLSQIEARFGKDGFGGRDWDRMMVRVGKPLSQITKPESLSGTEESYRRNLADWLARYKPDRSC